MDLAKALFENGAHLRSDDLWVYGGHKHVQAGYGIGEWIGFTIEQTVAGREGFLSELSLPTNSFAVILCSYLCRVSNLFCGRATFTARFP